MSDPSIPGLGPGYRLTVEDAPVEADVEVLPHALEAHNEVRWPQHPPWRPLALFLREEARIAAGLAGETYCGWLFVKYLWVSDGLRGRGIGRGLMARGSPRLGARLSLGMAGHIQLSGARLLRKARISGVRTARLPARPPPAFHAKTADPIGVAAGAAPPSGRSRRGVSTLFLLIAALPHCEGQNYPLSNRYV